MGLDDEVAERVRQILLRQIATIESALARDSNGSTTAAATTPENLEG